MRTGGKGSLGHEDRFYGSQLWLLVYPRAGYPHTQSLACSTLLVLLIRVACCGQSSQTRHTAE